MPAVAMARCNVNGKGAARCYETSPRTQVRATDLHEDVVREVFMTCLTRPAVILMIGVVACPRPSREYKRETEGILLRMARGRIFAIASCKAANVNPAYGSRMLHSPSGSRKSVPASLVAGQSRPTMCDRFYYHRACRQRNSPCTAR